MAKPASTPEEQAVAIVQPAMVYIETSWAAWVRDHEGDWLNGAYAYEWTVQCSGFVVNPSGYVVTAGHCVDDSLDHGARGQAIEFGVQDWIDNGWISADQRAGLQRVAYANWHIEGRGASTDPDRTTLVAYGRASTNLTTDNAWPARIVDVRSLNEGDVALLKVEQVNLPTIQVADGSMAIGSPVLSVGYPASTAAVTDQLMEPSFKDGRISSRGTREGGLLPVYEMSAALSGGMSGGPTVDLEGDVIGLNSFSVAGETQQFNFLSPASLIAELLSRNGVGNEPGPLDLLYREGLDGFFAGDHQAAIAAFDRVLDRLPAHQQAQEYRSQAAELAAQATPTPQPVTPAPVTPAPSPEPTVAPVEGDNTPLMAAGIIGGLIIGGLIVGVAVFALIGRRRGGRGPAAAPGTAAVTQAAQADAGWTPPGWELPTVPEPTFAARPLDVGNSGQHDVFVSYSTPDKPVADAIVARLEHEGIRCWVAPRDVIPGKVWSESIVHAIQASRLMVVVLSGEANQSQQVIREVERAVANNVVVVPFRIELIEPTGAMAYFLASEHWLDAMTPPIETHIAQLVKVANALLDSSPARSKELVRPVVDG